jgi:hypothetical protein
VAGSWHCRIRRVWGNQDGNLDGSRFQLRSVRLDRGREGTMTRKQTKQAIAIMQAYVDGKEIEFNSCLSSTWRKTQDPQWNWENEYRVATDWEKKCYGLIDVKKVEP